MATIANTAAAIEGATLVTTANVMVGDSGSGGTAGLVPAPAAGDAAAGKYLKADGTFAVPPGTAAAPTDAQYITLATNGTLSNERVLTAGTNITLTDGGAGSTLTIAASGGSGATISTSALASPPGSPASGDLWLPNNAPYIARYNGSSWDYFYRGFKTLLPSSGGPSTWVNQNSAVLTTTNGVITVQGIANAGPGLHCLVKTAPATPYTITTNLSALMTSSNYSSAGMIFRDSAGGGLVTFDFDGQSNIFTSGKWNSATSFSAGYTFNNAYRMGQAWNVWMRIADDGANRILSISTDGYTWIALHTVGSTDFITANQVGLYVKYQNATYGTLASWPVWLEA